MTPSMGTEQTDGAPIVQLLLTLSFEPALPDLTILDLAELARLFNAELPVFRQYVRAGPMRTVPDDDDTPDFQQMVGLPRISLATGDGGYQLLLQDDRISFGWMRTTPLSGSHDYPGFSSTFDNLMTKVAAVREWARARKIDIKPAVGEVVYTDAFLLSDSRRLSDILTTLNPAAMMSVVQFEYGWKQNWPTDREGFLEGSFAGPGLSPEGLPVASLESTGRFDIEGDWAAVSQAFSEAHGVMTDTYKALVTDGARATSQV